MNYKDNACDSLPEANISAEFSSICFFHPAEWIKMPGADKKLAVIVAFKEIASMYYSGTDIETLVQELEEAGSFEEVGPLTVMLKKLTAFHSYQGIAHVGVKIYSKR